MGTHLAATWAAAGMRVVLGSRTKSKAEAIVSSIVQGKGYRGSGGEQVPPFEAADMQLMAGTSAEAAAADIVVLVTPFPHTAALVQSLKKQLAGRGAVILDLTNPW